MAFLIDTTVVIDLGRGHPGVRRWWLAQVSRDVFIASVSVGELYRGVHHKHAGDARRLAAELSSLSTQTLAPFVGRVLVYDGIVAERWGRLMGEADARGRRSPSDDAKIAAIALHHGLTVATSNTRHIGPFCPTIDPRAA